MELWPNVLEYLGTKTVYLVMPFGTWMMCTQSCPPRHLNCPSCIRSILKCQRGSPSYFDQMSSTGAPNFTEFHWQGIFPNRPSMSDGYPSCELLVGPTFTRTPRVTYMHRLTRLSVLKSRLPVAWDFHFSTIHFIYVNHHAMNKGVYEGGGKEELVFFCMFAPTYQPP